MIRNFKTIALTILLLAPIGCCKRETNNFNIENEKQLIEKTIRSSIGWAKNKDINLLYSVIANDSSFLEVHPGPKVVIGFRNFRKAEEFWMNPEFKAIRYEIRDLTINISRSGDAAWWFCMLDDINEWKGEPANCHNEGAVWSPDGKRIAFTSTRSGNSDIWIIDVDIEKIKKELEIINL
ncbi:MAG: nuclear transport factor 2 family protein [Bacteroidales bacterium]|nr:nuclear transport factor 2 family protein [Bacteroidales bacterium]